MKIKAKAYGTGFVYYRRIIFTYAAVLLIPIVIIGLSNYIYMRNKLLDELTASINFEGEKQLVFLQQQIKLMNTAAYESRYSKTYSRLYMKDSPNSHLDMMTNIKAKEAMMPFCQSIYYYDNVGKKIFSSFGKYDKSFFDEQIVDTMLPTAIDEQMNGKKTTAVKIKHGLAKEDAVAILIPLSDVLNDEGEPETFLIFVILDRSITEQLSSSGATNGSFWVLSYATVPVYISSSELNEKLYTGEWDTEALNTTDSYIYDFKFESLISIKWVVPKRIFNEQVIHFVAMQSALMMAVLGVGLLVIYHFSKKTYSPIKSLVNRIGQNQINTKKMVDEFDYVNYALNDLLHNKVVLQGCNEDLKRERILYELLGRQTKRDDKLYQLCISESIFLNRSSLFFVLFDDTIENQPAYEFFEKMSETNSHRTNVYVLYLMENRFVYLVCTDEDTAVVQSWLDGLKEKGAVMGVGTAVKDVAMLTASYAHAKSELNALGHGGNEIIYPFEELRSLQAAVETENAERALFLIKEMLDEFEKYEKLRLLVGWDILSVLATKGQLSDYVSQKNTDMDYLRLRNCITDSYKAFEAVCSRQEDSGYRKKNIAEIVDYIDRNFTDCNFSIKGMAIDFGTTASNLSHFFKKSTGQSISQYIEMKKLDKAKAMLLDGSYKINEISTALGYNSTTMFIELFKKYEGVTPGTFKEKK